MKNTSTFQRILWAIDPFAEDAELMKKLGLTVRALSKESKVPVEPVSVVHWEDRVVLQHQPASVQELEREAGAKAKAIVASAELANTLPVRVLVQNDLSLGNAVRRLLSHAEETGADLIVVGTQAKKGVTRFLLGSFAETLVLQSRIPTVVVSPHCQPMNAIKRIVYPSDLTEKSKSAFPLVVQLAKELGASLTVFHRIEYLTKSATSFQPASEAYEKAFHEDVQRRIQEAEELLAIARLNGVTVDLNIQSKGDNAVEAVARLSEAPSTLIAMVSQTKSVESMVLGSVTRQVIRRASSPIWTIHPKRY